MATVTVRRPSFRDSTTGETVDKAAMAPDRVVMTAASTEPETPSRWVIGLAYGALGSAAVVALAARDSLKEPMALAMGASAFALFYVAAQAIERLMEPVAQFFHSTDKPKEEAEKAKGAAATAADAGAALAKTKTAADKEAEVKRKTRERAILFWALGSIIGIIASITLGLYFFAAILAPATPPAIPRWIDVIATGLVIGGGTKALHDLIGKAQKPPPASDTTTES